MKNVKWLLLIACGSLMHSFLLYSRNSITIIGIGRLGLCTALCFEKAGYDVLGVDLHPAYIESLNNKTFSSLEPQVSAMLQASTSFKATCSLDEGLEFADIYYIMVDTPSTQGPEGYDHTNVNTVLSEINKRKVSNKHIVIGCTVFPGYVSAMKKSLMQDCVNTTLSYNPEFIVQGNIVYGLHYPDIVLIGEGSKEAGDIIEGIYHRVCKNIPQICRMSPESAEITKLALNCFITTKIAYANMIGDIADKTLGANKFDILKAIGGDTRVGHLCLKPGYGFGGPCFPRDNRALGSYAQAIGIEPLILQATDASNKLHAEFMTDQLLHENKDTYVFEQVTYKDNCPVPIIDESQKLVVAAALAKASKKVVIIDTYPVIEKVKNVFGDIFEYQIIH